jgi:hypothetical protein
VSDNRQADPGPEQRHVERAQRHTFHYTCDDTWYQCPCATAIEDHEPVELARCNCRWSERVAKLAAQFAEVEREALANKIGPDWREALPYETELELRERIHAIVKAGDELRHGHLWAGANWDAATEGIDSGNLCRLKAKKT